MPSKRKRLAEKEERRSKTLAILRSVAQQCSDSLMDLNAIAQFAQSLQGNQDALIEVDGDPEETTKAPATPRQQGSERDANASTRNVYSDPQDSNQGGSSFSSNSENPSHGDSSSESDSSAEDHDNKSRALKKDIPILPDTRDSADGSAIEETDSGNNMTEGKSGDSESDSDSQAKDDGSDRRQESDSPHPSWQDLEMQCGCNSISRSFESDGKIRGAPISTTDPVDDTSATSDAEDTDYNTDINIEIEKIRRSKLSITLQGLRSKKRMRESEDDRSDSNSRPTIESRCDYSQRDQITFKGKKIRKGRCYWYREEVNGRELDAIVGIRQFISEAMAETILIIPFEETFLGMTDDESLESLFQPASHVQVEDAVVDVHCKYLFEEIGCLPTIPDLIYEPQTPGSWHKFSYYRANAKKRKGARREYRYLDFFAGCGGMSLGFQNCGFELVKAIENDSTAAETFTSNHNNAPMFVGDINVFLRRCEKNPDYRKRLGPIDYIHASAPCQGFSGANRTGGKNDKANNDLSLTFVDAVRITDPVTASYENVLGLWKRQHIHYLKRNCVGLLKLGYQVRCACLHACDYGDPQQRPRLFLLAAKSFAHLPSWPIKTHGPKLHQLPFVTAKDALGRFEGQFKEGGDPFPADHVKLVADRPAPAVRGSQPPVHYSENRRLYVEELAALQSFPADFFIAGNLTEQRKQIGNAVPVELATAVARSIRASLLYRYAEEGED